ncbi:MAG: peptidoglycan DD-metalloendopeptidase family protein [Candidatus Marinamargulisbacteria bacterium]|nr:peptidoglycan DD-metalloendopeptidase family protein [Candidatus Marinamargulisbacteria bacterium]
MTKYLIFIFLGIIAVPTLGTTPNAVKKLEQSYTNTEQKIDAQRQKQSKVLKELLTLDRNLTVKQTELKRLNANLKAYHHEQKSIEQRVTDSEAEFKTIQKNFEHRLRDIYKYQNFGFLEVLFSSHDLLSFFETAIWFEKLLTADIKLLKRIQKKHKSWLSYQRKVAQRKHRIQRMHQQANASLLDIQNTKKQKNKRLSTLNQTIKLFEQNNQALLASSSELASLIRKRKKTTVIGSMQFVKPVLGWLSSSFGYRTHPIFKRRIFHSGIDFAAPSGQKIIAADRGTVVFSGWWGGYGKATILDHGHNITSVYAHQSRIVAKKGQQVEKGQLIGYVGSTGYSTGPHLHFEVRKNGTPINPSTYFKNL